MERSSRLRMGCFDDISILPPRCIRNVRSETLPRTTPSMARSSSTISSACEVEEAAIVTSIRSFSWPEAVTSRPVTEPPEDSTAVVSWLTAVPLAGTSSRTVIEYETLGAVAMAEFLRFPELRCRTQHGARVPYVRSDRPTYRPVAGNDCHLSETFFHHTRSDGSRNPGSRRPRWPRSPESAAGTARPPETTNRPAPPSGDAGLSSCCQVTPTRHARLAASGRSKRRRLGPGAWIEPVPTPG